MAILRVGNKDLQMPGGEIKGGSVLSAVSHMAPIGPGWNDGWRAHGGWTCTGCTGLRGRGVDASLWHADYRNADRAARSASHSSRWSGRFTQTRDAQPHETENSGSAWADAHSRRAAARVELSPAGHESANSGAKYCTGTALLPTQGQQVPVRSVNRGRTARCWRKPAVGSEGDRRGNEVSDSPLVNVGGAPGRW